MLPAHRASGCPVTDWVLAAALVELPPPPTEAELYYAQLEELDAAGYKQSRVGLG